MNRTAPSPTQNDGGLQEMALDLTGAKLTFDDEFNTFSWNPDGPSSIAKDTTNNGTWTTHYYWGAGDRTLWGNSEQEYYADASTAIVQKYANVNPFSVSNGVLTITATPSPDASLTQGLSYVSGMITTDGTFSQQYGYFEMRAQLPTGGGSWPAFWLLDAAHTWPPEIDVVEMIGKEPGHLYTTGHSYNNDTTGMAGMTNVGDVSTAMHTYGVSIMPDYTVWYFDGQEVQRAVTPNDFKQPMYMIANLAEGGSWPGPADGTTDQMKIDYIRAYQLPGTSFYDSAVAVGATPTQTPTATPTAPVTATIGSGSDSLVLKLSQDFYLTSAQYTVSVDGTQVGGTQTAGAVHGSGQTDTLTVKGDWNAGSHTVTVNFLNDGYGGSTTLDRNLYIESATYDGAAVSGAAKTLWSAGPSSFGVTDTTGGATTPTSTPVTTTVGSGSDSLVLKVSQDWYQSAAQYTVSVDGVQVGGTLSAGAIHGSGQADTVTVKGDWAAGGHQVSVNFLNDAYGGSLSLDRNLYVEGATYDGANVSGAAKTFWSAGAQGFSVSDTTAVGSTGTVIGTGADKIVLKISEDAYNGDAQFTVSIDGVQQGGTQTAHALHSSAASDLFTIQGDWGVGSHQVQVNFLNDAYGGSTTADRNLYVDGITWNGAAVGGTPATLFSAGTKAFSATDSTAATGTADHTPAMTTIGTGSDKLYVKISEDAYNGDAQYTIKVDGTQIGGTLTAKALHGAGDDVITVQGDWAAGSHKLTVEFTNDLYGGSASADRNLYVDGVSFDDAAVPGGAVAVSGSTASMFSAGTHDFWFS